ncbi:sensor histidine kinase [Haloferula sp. BvORR071]|uniref:sensor histidine kinase n=1 Tax=Haloferula sp. BvORR071 TaxID=1396141 RepID=UPI0006977532|nr:sensor histidine kinase [Haloferula sp. BvORR071]
MAQFPASLKPTWTLPSTPWKVSVIGIAMIVAIGIVDGLIEPQLSSAFFYLLPVIYVGRHAGWWTSLGCAVLACVVSLNADLLTQRTQVFSYLPFSNASLRMGVLLIVLRLVRSLRDLNDSLEARVRDRTSRLQAEVKERLKLESRILEARESEQERIGQDLHDGLCQHLVATAFSASLLQHKLEAKHVQEAGEAAKIVELLDDSITQARDLSKGLYPVPLEKDGLETALQSLADGTTKRTGIKCTLDVPDRPVDLEKNITIHIYRIAQEAINNAVKHSGAERILIEFEAADDRFDLKVSDDGKGLPANPPPAPAEGGMGLHIMDYRARAIGAKLEVAEAKNGGTSVRCYSNGDISADE